MSLDIVIRKFIAKDADKIIQLNTEDLAGTISEDSQILKEYFDEYIKNPDSTAYFIAEIDKELVGYVYGAPLIDSDDDFFFEEIDNKTQAYIIEYILIKESQRGKGISKMLYNTIMSQASQEGYERLVTLVSKNNENSLRLQRSLGMKEILSKDSYLFSLEL